MFNPILNIKEFELNNDELTIAVKITCDADVRVRSPKVRVIFDNGKSIRRMPLLIEAYYISNDMKSNSIYAKYKYFLKNVYHSWDPNDKITIRIAFAYGDEYVEYIPFNMSRDITYHQDGYLIKADENNGTLHIVKEEPVQMEKNKWVLLKKIRTLFRFIYSGFLYVLGILLLPVFVLDAFASVVGISAKSEMNLSTGPKWYLAHIRWRYASFCKKNISIIDLKLWILDRAFRYYSHKPVVKNRVSFLSSRREDMTGNLGFVYEAVKQNGCFELQELLDPSSIKSMKIKNIIKLAYLSATSSVLLVDDFFPSLHRYNLREETKLIQLWHACGAFKTFGFTRLGKKGGPMQISKNHRNYDYAVVSSQEIAKYYAEGFGITDQSVVATGVPRTDIFFDKNYKERVVDEFYQQYPQLKNKKILLFAPTFRGDGKMSAYYPNYRFDPVEVYEQTNQEYAIIIKHHPFVTDRFVIPEEYKDYIIDMSEQSELNDLLFVTDLIITDYSSLIFEASLLDIPMLFYAYDLRRYIATRDFYYEYELFVPGKIVSSQAKIIEAMKASDFESYKIEGFKKRFFDHLDGCSTKRVVQLIREITGIIH